MVIKCMLNANIFMMLICHGPLRLTSLGPLTVYIVLSNSVTMLDSPFLHFNGKKTAFGIFFSHQFRIKAAHLYQTLHKLTYFKHFQNSKTKGMVKTLQFEQYHEKSGSAA